MNKNEFQTDNFVMRLHLEYHHVNPVRKLCYEGRCPVRGKVISREEANKMSEKLPKDLQHLSKRKYKKKRHA